MRNPPGRCRLAERVFVYPTGPGNRWALTRPQTPKPGARSPAASGTGARGRAWKRIPLADEVLTLDQRAEHVVALDEALTRLGAVDPRLATVVEYRFFAGLSEADVAGLMDMTPRTIRRDWAKTRGWLHRELSTGGGE